MVFKSDESLNQGPELSLEIIKHRAIKGVIALTGRTFIIQIITLFSTFFLTVFLSPQEYGTFFLVSAVINFFAYFSDIGLAAALIQKKEQLSEEDLSTVFTVQQILVIGLLILVLLLSPLLVVWYKMEQASIYLLWSLAFSLLLSSLKTIPSVILERQLSFNKLIIPQIVETVLFNIVVVYLAVNGYGITSFTAAVLVRGVSGLLIMYLIQPWVPKLSISRSSLKSLFKFGLPYQLNSILAVFKDDGMTAILGIFLGSGGIGLLGWAQKWAFAPLRFFMDQVIKVTFPTYSRIQEDKRELSSAVSKSLFFICLIIFPSLVFLVLLIPVLTEIIPRYEKWKPALLALTLISINSSLAAITTPLTNMLNSIGKIHITFKLMIMWTVLTWVFVPALAMLWGVTGAAAGYLIVGLSSVIAIMISRKYVDFNLWQSIGKPLLSSLVLAAVIILIRPFAPVSYLGIAELIVLGFSVYGVLIYILTGPVLVTDIKKIIFTMKSRAI